MPSPIAAPAAMYQALLTLVRQSRSNVTTAMAAVTLSTIAVPASRYETPAMRASAAALTPSSSVEVHAEVGAS